MTDAIAVLVWLTFDAACVFWAIRGYVAWLDWRDAKQAARIAAEEAHESRNVFDAELSPFLQHVLDSGWLAGLEEGPPYQPVTLFYAGVSPHPLGHPCFSSSRSLVELFAGEREGGEA